MLFSYGQILEPPDQFLRNQHRVELKDIPKHTLVSLRGLLAFSHSTSLFLSYPLLCIEALQDLQYDYLLVVN